MQTTDPEFMPAPTTPDEAIAQAVLGPKKITVGNQATEEFGLDELVKAANYLAAKNAGSVPGFGIRIQQAVPVPPGGC